MVPMSLRQDLADWTDIDMAACVLAVSLGLFPDRGADGEPTPGEGSSMKHKWGYLNEHKWVFWTANPVGNDLTDFLERLANLGVLEFRDEPDLQYRWNPSWDGTLEALGAVDDD